MNYLRLLRSVTSGGWLASLLCSALFAGCVSSGSTSKPKDLLGQDVEFCGQSIDSYHMNTPPHDNKMSVLVGPDVALTAAHAAGSCMSGTGVIFYETQAWQCKCHPDRPKRPKAWPDLSICKTSGLSSQFFENINTVDDLEEIGKRVLLVRKSDTVIAEIIEHKRYGFIVNRPVKFGDSGGPVFACVVNPNGTMTSKIVGIIKGKKGYYGAQVTSTSRFPESKTDTVKWLRQQAAKYSAEICGINSQTIQCR